MVIIKANADGVINLIDSIDLVKNNVSKIPDTMIYKLKKNIDEEIQQRKIKVSDFQTKRNDNKNNKRI